MILVKKTSKHSEISVEAGHEIGGKFKKMVLDANKDIVDVLVHIEPWKGIDV